jgi:hypothetical protein
MSTANNPAATEATITAKTWDKARVNSMILSNPLFVSRALLVLYKRQTTDEKAEKTAKHNNKRGFNIPDAPYMSHCAQWLLANPGKVLTGDMLTRVQVTMFKYWAQLVEEANKGQAAKDAAKAMPAAAE